MGEVAGVAGSGDGLWLRLIGDANQYNDLATHSFSGEVYFYAEGKETLAEITALFDLQGRDLTDLSEIKSLFTGKGAAADRVSYAIDLEHALELAEVGLWDRARFNSRMGLTW